jgi:2-oxoisovalerate dehydrogenase E1 component alpha subunit
MLAERTGSARHPEDGLSPAAPLVCLIDSTGKRQGHRSDLPDPEEMLAGYRSLVVGRRLNTQASALVRQGRLAVYPSSHGQEASQVACAAVLRAGDWLFPTYRDTVAIVERGVDPVEVLGMLQGNWHCGYDPVEHRVAPQTTPLATQLIHAVGVGHAARLKGESTVVMALCGDGATSEGDFHEALNFAAVMQAPVIFFVQNNQYAISVPLARQSVAPSLAAKGVGYGVPAYRVDGNDLAALLVVLHEAVNRASAGNGPTLVVAETYRVQAHTNADDATRYRSQLEVEAWITRDPLLRLRSYLVGEQLLTDELEAEFAAAAEASAAKVRAGMTVDRPADPADLFRFVYATPTPQLAAQSALLQDELAAEQV